MFNINFDIIIIKQIKEIIMAKHNSEEKRDTINKMKNDIENTEFNMRQTEKMISSVDNELVKSELELQNFRREQSLRNMKKNIENEYDKENNIKNNLK
jgi:small acid-soluble spore protein (thioredoxin-like protein)